MITITLTNRDRDLRIVKNCLDSLALQSVKIFQVFLIDYGSNAEYVNKLETLTKDYTFLKLIVCAVQGQLWNKSRAINIVLQQTVTPYFLVGDIDLIFHPDFIKKATELAQPKEVHYFQYGFLSKEESLENKAYDLYQVDFKGNDEVTGTTLFPTETLKEVNGYDEFYHGWGAEDTDIHIRMSNMGLSVNFFNAEILVKHQWHPKAYRSKKSINPFHSKLEKINNSYMQFTASSKRTKINMQSEWGKMQSELEYQKLQNNADYHFVIPSLDVNLSAILFQLKNFENKLIKIVVKDVSLIEKLKQKIKQILGKKYKTYIKLQDVNDRFLEEIVSNYSNNPYCYIFEREKGKIELTIQF